MRQFNSPQGGGLGTTDFQAMIVLHNLAFAFPKVGRGEVKITVIASNFPENFTKKTLFQAQQIQPTAPIERKEKEKGLPAEQEAIIVQKMHEQVDSAFNFARKSEYPNANDAMHDVFVNGHLNGRALV